MKDIVLCHDLYEFSEEVYFKICCWVGRDKRKGNCQAAWWGTWANQGNYNIK